MSEYRKIGIRLWRSKRFAKVGETAKLMYVYFLTNPHTNTIGLYEIPLSYIPLDTGLEQRAIHRAIVDLSEAGLIAHDPENDLILIERWLDHSPITNKKHLMGAITRVLSISPSKLKLQRIQELIDTTNKDKKFKDLNNPLTEYLQSVSKKPYPSDSPTIGYPHDNGDGDGNVEGEYPPTQPPFKSKRGTRWKNDTVWGEWISWTQKTFPLWTPERIFEQEAIFCDYWKSVPGKKGVKLDWFATWRNWCRKENSINETGDDKIVKEILAK